MSNSHELFESSEPATMTESRAAGATVLWNSDATYYCVPGIARDGAIWLSVQTFAKPVGPEWRYPNSFGVVLMRGRDYVRRFTRMRLTAGRTETLAADSPMVADWRDAAWWTPGLAEAWAELDARAPHIAHQAARNPR